MNELSPPRARRRALHLLALLSAACASQPTFEEEFPQPEILLTTADSEAAFRRLQHVELPDTDAHRQRLLALLRSRASLNAAQLALLCHAVAPHDGECVYQDVRGRFTYPARGTGQAAATVDRLLVEGIDKLDPAERVPPLWFGRLCGISQSDATLSLLCDRLLARADDGSDEAVLAMLEGMPGSPARLPFLVGQLAPRQRLRGDCGWRVCDALSFDDERLSLLTALLQNGSVVDDGRLLALLRGMVFDDARRRVLELCVPVVTPLRFDLVRAAAEEFAFDADRERAVAVFARRRDWALDEVGLTQLLACFAFDESRGHCLRAVRGQLVGTPDGKHARAVLRQFAFDDDRVAAVAALADRWRSLPADERARLLEEFSFDSSRSRAAGLLVR